MVVVPGGTSLVIGGLDFWYARPDVPGKNSVVVDEFKFEEWRLQRALGVGHFRLPPDFRERRGETPNTGITVPSFRFPAWHFCPDCKLLIERPLYERGTWGRIKCPECQSKKKTRYMFQVPFVATCEIGHLQDFPWNEWVHRSASPACNGPLRLESTGSATLAGQRVRCVTCRQQRTLESVTTGSEGTTYLSATLANGTLFLCQGRMPWLGPDAAQPCGAHLKGSLRSAANVYFAQVRSSIYLPRLQDRELQELEDMLQHPPLSTLAKALVDLGADDARLAETMRSSHGRLVQKYTDQQIVQAVHDIFAPATRGSQDPSAGPAVKDPDWQTAFRREEFDTLRTERDEYFLKIRRASPAQYQPDIARYFSRVMLVDKLRETRALTGFTRIYPENNQDIRARQQMLWRSPPVDLARTWLPAYTVYGEGIYFELGESRLQTWEEQTGVRERVRPLASRHARMQTDRHLSPKRVTPRFVLLHTFAHLIMNRLTFECGYSSAALRERLYISENRDAPMAGVMIYTADGDSEGTMGGLVRMGRPGSIEPVIRRALEGAQWCSADPVCMEIGRHQGQGPDSCNLAACHNCALVPETACEEFNRFLDRALVVGEIGNSGLGFFDFQH
jgi:hypothetical protein